MVDRDALFDPNTPLPDEVVFMHDMAHGGFTAWLQIIAGVPIVLVSLTGYWEAADAYGSSMRNFWFLLILTTVFVGFGLWLLYRAYENRRLMHLGDEGRYRYGLFFLDDLMIWRTPKKVHEWPREKILKVHTQRAAGGSGTNAVDLIVTVNTPEGRIEEHNLKTGVAYGKRDLVEWFNGYWLKYAHIPVSERFERWRSIATMPVTKLPPDERADEAER